MLVAGIVGTRDVFACLRPTRQDVAFSGHGNRPIPAAVCAGHVRPDEEPPAAQRDIGREAARIPAVRVDTQVHAVGHHDGTADYLVAVFEVHRALADVQPAGRVDGQVHANRVGACLREIETVHVEPMEVPTRRTTDRRIGQQLDRVGCIAANERVGTCVDQGADAAHSRPGNGIMA